MSGGVLSAIGLVGSVVGPLLGGMEERGALKAQAKADRENANRTEFQGELDAWQTTREARLAQGAGLAMAAADGNVVGTGTIADLVEQAAIEREMEIGNLRARARGEAANLRASARDKERAAKFALVKGVLGAVVGGAGEISAGRNAKKLADAEARKRGIPNQSPLARGRTGDGSNMSGSIIRTGSRWGSTRLPGN